MNILLGSNIWVQNKSKESREENPQSTILYNYPECLVEPLNCKNVAKTIDTHLLVEIIKQFGPGLFRQFYNILKLPIHNIFFEQNKKTH